MSQREIELVTRVLKQHRYFEKNHAILSLSFELGLTPKEIASLNIVDVVTFSNKKHWHSFRLRESVRIKNQKSQKMGETQAGSGSQRKYTFSLPELTRLIDKVIHDYDAEILIDICMYLPEARPVRKYTRVLPLVSEPLKRALIAHIDKHPFAIGVGDHSSASFREVPMFVSQKRGRYSPNTMQDHMRLILAGWAGLEGASGLSGRRTLVDKMVRERIPIKTIQQYLGHQSPSTTALYEDIDVNERDYEEYAFSKVQNETTNS